MIKLADEKILATGISNLRTKIFDLEHSDLEDEKFDLIFTQMVLHHVADVGSVINRFSKLLNSGGYLAIADLYEEDGSFHGESFTGHKGFNPEKLASVLATENFKDIRHKQCYNISSKISETESEQFPVFIMIGNRR